MTSATIAVEPKMVFRLSPSVLLQRTDTKSRDAVSHLVKGDQAARNRSSDSGQFFLAKANGQRQ